MPKSIYEQVIVTVSTSMLQQNSDPAEHMLFFNFVFPHVAGFQKRFQAESHKSTPDTPNFYASLVYLKGFFQLNEAYFSLAH